MTLFRYPGPCGLGVLLGLDGTLKTLGPPESETLWLSDTPLHRDVSGARHFGTLALLQPERFAPTPAGPPGLWIAANRPPTPADPIVWVPPSRLRAPIPWTDLRTPTDAAPWLADADATERPGVIERLFAYLEELSNLHAAGAPGPGVPWCEVPAPERRRILAAHRVQPTWTKAPEVARAA